ncbi:uncharacterized protein LOC110232650 [Exaiptasia diaphana]|uniref:Uncharacterized protein n=1 Tax=Exaiptasia diaphana TaxID=2652724 RepID=A0A913WSQ1_EXADI|nr:uncharacterized protein LOC110232650 [Exaiptasia diaphana]
MLREKEERGKINMKLNFDTHHSAKPLPVLQQGDQVWIKDRKESATVKDKVHERSYLVETQNSTFRRNRVQLNKLPKKGPNLTQSTPTTANKERTKPEHPTAQQNAREAKAMLSPHLQPTLQTRSGRTIRKPDRLIEQ